MGGIMRLNTGEFVGKISEYKTSQEFVDAILKEEGKEVDKTIVSTTYMRYYPKGTEDSRFEFGKGEGVYMTCGKERGAFKVWII